MVEGVVSESSPSTGRQDEKKSGWNWAGWNNGQRLIMIASIVALVSLFMTWRDAVFVSLSGFETEEAWIGIALFVYPAIAILRNAGPKRTTAIVLGVLAIVWGAVVIGTGIETMEADGVLFEEETTLDFNGVGVYLYFLAAVGLLIGAIKHKPKQTSGAESASPAQQDPSVNV